MEAYIKNATEQFEKLLREQIARTEKMKKAAPATDFSKAQKVVIGIVDGDGIGPIITKEGRQKSCLRARSHRARSRSVRSRVLPLKTDLPKIRQFPPRFWQSSKNATSS